MKLESHPALGARAGANGVVSSLGIGVTVSERARGDCVLCTAAVDAKEIAGALSRALAVDVPLKPGALSAKGNCAVSWLAPRSWLVHAPAGQADRLVAAVAAAFPDRRVHASLYSDQLCWIAVEGEGAEVLLRQGGFISLEREGLPVGSVKRTRIADIHALIWRQAAGTWLLGIERGYTRAFLDWVLACDGSKFEESGR